MPEQRLAEYQFTREEAVAFGEGRSWRHMTPAERGLLALRQDLLCMPFAVVHEGVTALLGRPVYTHVFAKPDLLWEEYLGIRGAPSFQDIIDKLPEHLRCNAIVVCTGAADGKGKAA